MRENPAQGGLVSYIEKDLPLEQRLKGIGFYKGGINAKVDQIVSSSLPFFEKLYFLRSLITNEAKFNETIVEIFRSMDLGEIVSELVKPELVYLGQREYPGIDFRLVFSDERYSLYEQVIQTMPRAETWLNVREIGERVIGEKYLSGLQHFAYVISLMNESQPFLSGQRKLRFLGKNEKEYVLDLFDLAMKVDSQNIPDDVKEFMQLARNRKSRIFAKKDVIAQLNGMEKNHVTLFGFEYESRKGNTPAILTFRVKTFHSMVNKAIAAYSALLAFYGETKLVGRIYNDLPELLESVIKSKPNGQDSRLIGARDWVIHEILQDPSVEITRQTREKAYEIWNSLSDKRKSAIWDGLRLDIRGAVVSSLGTYGSLIEKYNTWYEVQNVFGDLFALSLGYQGDYSTELVEKRVINPMLAKQAKILVLPPFSIEYIDRKVYSATHLDLYAEGFEGSQKIEVHLTNIARLLSNDTVGEGCHTLHHLNRVRNLIQNIPRAGSFVRGLAGVFGEKIKQDDGTYVTEGMLSCIKQLYPEFNKSLVLYGVPTSVSP